MRVDRNESEEMTDLRIEFALIKGRMDKLYQEAVNSKPFTDEEIDEMVTRIATETMNRLYASNKLYCIDGLRIQQSDS